MTGNLETYSVRDFLAELPGDPAECDLTIDLRGVTLLDSAGVRTLAGLARHANRHGRTVTLICPRGVRRLFTLAGLDHDLRFTPPPVAVGADDHRAQLATAPALEARGVRGAPG